MGAPALNLSSSVDLVRRMRTELMQEYGLDADDPAILDTLDGETDLGDRIAGMLRQAREIGAMAEALAGMMAESGARKQRLERKAEGLRKVAAWAGQEAGLPTLLRPDMTVSFTVTKPALTGEADPDALPDDLVRITRAPNKGAIKDALQAGRAVEGYAMSNGYPSLNVRWR